MENNNRFTVLIVDDSKENVDLLMEVLSEHYETSVALNGKDAIELVSFEPPDLILLDVVMPEMDGYAVCQQLQQSEKTKEIPIIFVTAKDDVSNETKGLDLGAVDYITKPIVPEIVLARVRNHLELKAARQKLKQQNEQLKRMIKMREELSHMIIHDIRSPLASISGACEVITIMGINEDTMSFVEDIQERAEYACSFADDLLMLAKAEEGELFINRSEVDVIKLIESVQKNYSYVSTAKEMQIITELNEDAKHAFLDENLFKRVLDNLISNAVKYSPTKSKVLIKLEKSKDCKYFHLQVCDEGVGIAPENREKIFDKFTIANMNERGIKQVGLGLAFCKMVVDAHKGKIYVTDNHPGSIFHLEM